MRQSKKKKPQQLDLFSVEAIDQDPKSPDVFKVQYTLNIDELRRRRKRVEEAVMMWHLFKTRGREVARA